MALFFFGVLLTLTSCFLMLLILVQRGKGGGLTGALGGMGGQSAFGAKAGDAFTKITTVTAIVWITLCMITIALFNPPPKAATVLKKQAESNVPSDIAGSMSADPATEDQADESEGDTTADDSDTPDEGNVLDLGGDDAAPGEEPSQPVDPDENGSGANGETNTDESSTTDPQSGDDQ